MHSIGTAWSADWGIPSAAGPKVCNSRRSKKTAARQRPLEVHVKHLEARPFRLSPCRAVDAAVNRRSRKSAAAAIGWRCKRCYVTFW